MNTQKPTTGEAGDYRLRVKNFGPIIEAEVEMRPLTVFVGPSNSGKSYLAGLLYAMHRNSAWAGIQQEGIGAHTVWPRGPAFEFSDSLKRDLRSWLTAADFSSDLPATLRESLRRDCQRQIAQALAYELRRCFGLSDLSALERWTTATDTRIEWDSMPLSTDSSSVSFHLSRDSLVASISGLPPVSVSDYRFWRGVNAGSGNSDLKVDLLADEMATSVFENGFSSTRYRAHYLPGDRSGLIRNQNTVVRNLIHQASTGAPRPTDQTGPTLPGIAADFLEQVTSIRPKGARGDYRSVGAELESRVLDGKIEVRFNPFGSPEFFYRADATGSEELPLQQASSMVSGMASLVLFLYWRVQSGNILVIEEPEAHVHPAKQTELARQLVRMVRAGIRVVITTHSEWLLEQLGNLIQLSQLQEKRRAEFRNADFSLDPGEVGVWLFREDGDRRGSMVEEIRVDPEEGSFPTDFGSVREVLYNENAAIYNRGKDPVD